VSATAKRVSPATNTGSEGTLPYSSVAPAATPPARATETRRPNRSATAPVGTSNRKHATMNQPCSAKMAAYERRPQSRKKGTSTALMRCIQ
jgi:hypothetical protein